MDLKLKAYTRERWVSNIRCGGKLHTHLLKISLFGGFSLIFKFFGYCQATRLSPSFSPKNKISFKEQYFILILILVLYKFIFNSINCVFKVALSPFNLNPLSRH